MGKYGANGQAGRQMSSQLAAAAIHTKSTSLEVLPQAMRAQQLMSHQALPGSFTILS
jgi:hypothetical protein